MQGKGCYILQREVDSVLHNNRYKIGKTADIQLRLRSSEYRNATLHNFQNVENIDACEAEIIKEFSKKFQQIKSSDQGSYGTETFEGNILDMIKIFKEIYEKYNHPVKDIPKDTINPHDFTQGIIAMHTYQERDENIKTTVKMEGEEIIKIKSYKDLKLFYRVDDKLIHLTRLTNLMSEKYAIDIDLYKYMETMKFHLELLLNNIDLYPRSHVYLSDMQNGTFEIGTCKNLNKDNVKYISKLYLVNNEDEVEKEVLERMKEKYDNIEGSDHIFKCKKIGPIIKLFTSIASKHKLLIKDLNPKLIDTSMTHVHYFSGLYGNADVARIIIKEFCALQDDLQIWESLIESSINDDDSSLIHIIEDEISKENYLVYRYKGYLFIKQMHGEYYNASKFVASVTKVSQHARKSLNKFITQNVSFLEELEDFKELYHKEGIIDNTENENVKLKGIYVHEILMHSVIRWACPKHSLMLIDCLYKLIKMPA